MHRSWLLILLLGLACAPKGTARGQGSASKPALAEERVHFLDQTGLFACGWNEGEVVVQRAMASLGPKLDRCAASQGDDAATWSVVVSISPAGKVERTSSPSHLDGDEPPKCALEALAETRFRSGPPTCGSVLWLRFEVAASS